ncbi:hypothetical protein [Pseudomonas mosselii]|uniref:hypothetical protein n=1 Tax=Pseudomonas mosselii TaxID=78327 RepID=UPI000BB49703|nr:hypothetical protein [Pseudomonas mosselii]ATB63774.1 hypothetical protein CLJ08_03730 [Pseudomonas mosselii]
MTTKQDVAAALKAFADDNAKKASSAQIIIDKVYADLNKGYQTLNKWVYLTEGVKVERDSSMPLFVGDKLIPSDSLSIKFAGTEIEFRPEMKGDELYIAVDLDWNEEKRVLLKPKGDAFEAYGQSSGALMGTYDDEILYREIIRITKARSA